MTDKQIIEALKKAKDRCEELGNGRCDECPFHEGALCLIPQYVGRLARALNRWPSQWDMEIIERIIND